MADPIGRRGRLVTLEGGEGAGKSTQSRLLGAWLAGKGIPVLTTREPGGTQGAEDIRALLVMGEPGRWDPLTETLLHYAARREHVARCIAPALAAGTWVISDRFFDSTLAYQGYGQGVDHRAIATIRDASIGDFAPDLTLILDIPAETRRARVAARSGPDDRYERMDEAFHGRVSAGFRAIAAAEPDRCVIVDADRPIAVIAARICAEIVARLMPSGD
jgi:dTMP kinase